MGPLLTSHQTEGKLFEINQSQSSKNAFLIIALFAKLASGAMLRVVSIHVYAGSFWPVQSCSSSRPLLPLVSSIRPV